MPISAIEDCGERHWAEVKRILTEAIATIGDPQFEIELVSEEVDVGVIHRRIVQNLFEADMIVCDVSHRNPNVMFELGMRLTFDKATVIVKDDKTPYSFDTSIVEHIGYPRDLRFHSIVDFQKKLAAKVLSTYKASKQPNYTAFLKHFVSFSGATLPEKEKTLESVLSAQLEDIQRQIARLSSRHSRASGLDMSGSPRRADNASKDDWRRLSIKVGGDTVSFWQDELAEVVKMIKAGMPEPDIRKELAYEGMDTQKIDLLTDIAFNRYPRPGGLFQ